MTVHPDRQGQPWRLHKLSWHWRIAYLSWTGLCWAGATVFGIMQRHANGGSVFDQTMEQLVVAVWFLGFIVLTAVWLLTRPKNGGSNLEDWQQP